MIARSVIFPWIVLILILSVCSGCMTTRVQSKAGTQTTVILIRHADRDDTGQLTAKGHKRAKALVEAVKDKGITAIYSPNITRNLDTVKPLSDQLGIDITRTPKASLLVVNRIIDEILTKHAGGVVLWVGNVSGNLQAIYGKLGGKGDGPLKYGDLFVMTIPDHGGTVVEKLRF